MPTTHLVRLIIVVPLNRRAAMLTWWRANIDAGEVLDVGLNASGNGPATHFWLNTSLTLPDLKKIALRLLNLASIAPPTDWESMTWQQRKQWLLDQRQAIRTATGIRIRLADNDGFWDRPEDELSSAGLKRLTPV